MNCGAEASLGYIADLNITTTTTTRTMTSGIEGEGTHIISLLPKLGTFAFGLLSLEAIGSHKSFLTYQGPGKQT